MISALGLDLVDIAAFASQLADPASIFAQATFTAAEIAAAADRPDRDPARHLAARWAAKEAFVKAWATSRWGQAPALAHVDMREIEVVCDALGRPALALHGAVAAAVAPGLRVHVSLTHDGGFAAAVVVLEQ